MFDFLALCDVYRCRIHGLPYEVTLFSPIIAILAINLFVYCLVLRRFYLSHKIAKTSLSGSGQQQSQNSAIKIALFRSMAFASLLGLTWITGLFMFDNASLPVQYLFTVAVSLQGLSIFLLQCVANPDIRKRWSGLFKQAKPRQPRHSNTLESDVEMVSNRRISSSSENALVTPIGKKNTLFQIFSPKPLLTSPVSPGNALCEIFENTTIPEVANPLHRMSKEGVQKAACDGEKGP